MATRDRRLIIMQAAEKLFATRRLHEITLDDVVREARIGKGTIYRYFQDKDDLFFQSATRGFEELCDLLTRKVPNAAPFPRQLLSACRHISEFLRTRRQLFRMMQSQEVRMQGCAVGVRHRWTQQRKKLVAAVAAILRKGVREGRIRKDVPAEVLATLLLGLLRTRARDLADVAEPQRSLGLIVDVFLQGAAAPRATAMTGLTRANKRQG